MKSNIKKLANFIVNTKNSLIEKLLSVNIKLIGYTTILEIIIKIIGLTGGFMIIRLLPVEEYAYYTIGNSIIGSLAIIGDAGIRPAVMALGGQVFRVKSKMGEIMATALKLRKKFGVYAYLTVMPICFGLLLKNGASNIAAILVCLSILPVFYADLSSKLYNVNLLLHGNHSEVQNITLKGSVVRILLQFIGLFLFPFAGVAILANGLATIVSNILLQKKQRFYYPTDSNESDLVKKEIVKTVNKQLPNSIYFSVSGNIKTWLVSIFGTSTNIAQIGALGRIQMGLTVLNNLFSKIVVPWFVSLPPKKNTLFKYFFLIEIIMILFVLGLYFFLIYFSNQILWVLGDAYSGLNKEFKYLAVTICIGLVTTILHSLNINRAYVLNPKILIPSQLLILLSLIFMFPPTSTLNAIYIGLGQTIFNLILKNIVFIYYVNKDNC